eukprot:EG_transcript_3263
MASPIMTRRSMPRASSWLPADVLHYVFAMAPLDTLRHCALVSHRWSPIASRAAALHRRTAERLLRQGQTLMEAVLSPVGCVELFHEAIRLYPGLTEASYWLAKVLLILKRDAEAVDCLHYALRQRPSPVNESKLKACLLYTQSDDYQASKLLEAALALAPHDPCIHFELGFCYHGMQEFVKAISSYSRALHLQYNRVFVLLANRANCLHWCGRMEDALQDLKRSLDISPHYELALRTRAHVFIDVGNMDAACDDLTNIIDHCADPRAVSNAYFHRALCRLPVDEADLDRARRVDPTNLDPVQHHASMLVQANRLPEAIAILTEWIEGNPNHPDLADQLIFRAEIYERGFELDSAIEDYKRAVASLPREGSQAISERLQQLERLRADRTPAS